MKIMHQTNPTVTDSKSVFTAMTVVESKPLTIEREIDHYVKSIQSLINRLQPSAKQQYYNGLLAFIVNEQIELTKQNSNKKFQDADFSRLTANELTLLEEMSAKMHQLYSLIDENHE